MTARPCTRCWEPFQPKYEGQKYCSLVCFNHRPLAIKTRRDENGCYICTSHRAPPGPNAGYPLGMVDKKQIRLMRYVFFVWNGRWPNVTRHTCDNRMCLNPLHLLDGTHADNSRDMVERNRMARGLASSRGKLTDDQVVAIRESRKGNRQAAVEFGVNPATISRIRSGKRR